MARNRDRNARRQKRKIGIRKKVFGTPERPRLLVYRSLQHIYAQIIDDTSGATLVSACSAGNGKPAGCNKAVAEKVGAEIGEKAVSLGIRNVVFDRNGFLYHGKVKTLADAARKSGLNF